MLELNIAAYILSNLHTVGFLNSQIRIQAFALVTEPNISTRSSGNSLFGNQELPLIYPPDLVATHYLATKNDL